MYIEAVPNRNSPPAILLRESFRHEGKVRKRTLCNLSGWSPAHVEGLRGVLKGGTVIAAEHDAFTVTRSLPHGHVAAALGTARRIGLDRMLGPGGNRCRDLVLAVLASVVAKAQRSATAVAKQTTGPTEDGFPVHSFRSLLADLATLARNTITTAITPDYPLTVLTRPTPVQQK